MKYLSLIFCVSLLAVTAPAPSARADVAVPVDFFYDALSPHGDWVYTDNYGYVWEPAVAQQSGWAPYSDGYWAYTDAGWTWISNEDFGWATYHYGRWIRMFSSWFWVPGYEWAPAWVSWRQSDDHIGWAPLPPEARWTSNVGFSTWTDSYYDIGPSYYSFVPMRSFATRTSLRPIIVDRSRNVTFIDRSVNITNISYRENVVNNIFVGGPDPARIERFGSPLRRLTLRRDEEGFRRNWLDNGGRGFNRRGDFSTLSRIESDQLIVAAPSVRRENAPALPPRVRERFERPEIDRGWRNIGDSALAERLRSRQREELADAPKERLPEKAPTIVTAQKPPPAVGRELRPEERQLVERADPSRVDEEVRKAEPQPTPGMTRTPGVVDQPPTRPGAPDRDGPGGARRPDGMRPDGTRPDGRADTTRPDGTRPGEGRVGTTRPDGTRPDGTRPEGSRADTGRLDGRPGMGNRPDDRDRPPRPGEGRSPGRRGDADDNMTTGPRRSELRPVPRGVVPNEGGDRRRGGLPSNPEQPATSPEPRVSPPQMPEGRGSAGRLDRDSPEGRRPTPPDSLTPPRTPAIPMPEARPETRVRPTPMPEADSPRTRPVPMPQPDRPPQVRPSLPDRPPQSRPSLPERAQPQARPEMPRPSGRPEPQARPSGPPQGRPEPQARPSGPPGGGDRGPGGGRGNGNGPGGGGDKRGRD